jgi:hypothetical protein
VACSKGDIVAVGEPTSDGMSDTGSCNRMEWLETAGVVHAHVMACVMVEEQERLPRSKTPPSMPHDEISLRNQDFENRLRDKKNRRKQR